MISLKISPSKGLRVCMFFSILLLCQPAVGQEVLSSLRGDSLDEKAGTFPVIPICAHLALLRYELGSI